MADRYVRSIARLAVTACLAAAPAGATGRRAHPSWMVGEWVYLPAGRSRGPADCEDDDSRWYYADGNYRDGGDTDERGRWWIEGETLFQKVTHATDGDHPGTSGTVYAMRFRRVAPGEIRLAGSEPGSEARRCRPVAKRR